MNYSRYLEIGDRVILNFDKDQAIKSVYRGIPNGTEGVISKIEDVLFFVRRWDSQDREPGAYHKRGGVTVYLDDGREIPGDYCVSLKDEALLNARREAMRDETGRVREPMVFLHKLPSTRLWELDKVRVTPSGGSNRAPFEGTIQHINYYDLHKTRRDGSPMSIYTVKLPSGGTTDVEDGCCELIARGNLWKQAHGVEMSFASDEEELQFAIGTNQVKEVQNPGNSLYCWPINDALEAIKRGEVHHLTPGSVKDGQPTVYAYRCVDENLGARIAARTLANFADQPTAA